MHFFFFFFFFFWFLARHKIISFSKSRPWVYFYHIVTTAQSFNLDFLIEYLVVHIKKRVYCGTFKLGSITSRCSRNEPALHSVGFKLFEIRTSSNNSWGDYFKYCSLGAVP